MEQQSLYSQEVFIILGMHRSGTSMLAGALSLCNFYLGNNLMNPSSDNAKGYFEHNEIVRIHDEFLNNIGYSWNDIRTIPASINEDVIRLGKLKKSGNLFFSLSLTASDLAKGKLADQLQRWGSSGKIIPQLESF